MLSKDNQAGDYSNEARKRHFVGQKWKDRIAISASFARALSRAISIYTIMCLTGITFREKLRSVGHAIRRLSHCHA